MFVLLGAVVGAALGVVVNWIAPPPWVRDHPGRVVAMIAGLAAAGALLTLGAGATAVDGGDATPGSGTAGPTQAPAPTELTTAPPPAVIRGAFISPTDGQEVRGRYIPARGSVEGISSLSPVTLLCIFKDDLSNYYPYPAQVANSMWSVDIGTGPARIDKPKRVTFILASATPSAVDTLKRMREQNPDDYDNNGLMNLPEGIQSLAEVVITRTS